MTEYHNLPREYVDESPELHGLLHREIGSWDTNALFYRVFTHPDWIDHELAVNEGRGLGDVGRRGDFNYGVYKNFRVFSHWGVSVTSPTGSGVEFEGTGDSPLTALRDGMFRYLAEKANVLEM